ncbi:MAG: ASKHA domain-containing protein [Eubacteriales bacterium]|nr:ASKHA domain-containing protein [Eubacteriales bacterium]
MPILTVLRQGRRTELAFEGMPTLAAALRQGGFAVEQPCGGRGVCAKCRVRAEGCLSPLTEKEREAGSRLACQTVLLGDAEVQLPPMRELAQIEPSGVRPAFALDPVPGAYGLAVDVGTTTLAASLLRLADGETLAAAACANPQRSVAADVIGRIDAAMNGQGALLRRQAEDGISALRRSVCAQAGVERVDAMAVTGNTTMLYLLTGRDPAALSHAPFQADWLAGEWMESLAGVPRAYLPRCLSAFVGADAACALLASGLCEREETALLADVGTNGELALWHGGRLYVCAASAGPAFEGGVECGCAGVAGAIDRVWQQNDALGFSTIAGAPPVGLCGSGVIDAVAALLALERLDETGLLEEPRVELGGGVALTQRDVRAVQLAKGAIAAGMMTLLQTVDVKPERVSALYLAGGFGKHLDVRSAAAIGLIPSALRDRTRPLGNAALAGAEMLLLRPAFARDLDRMASLCRVVPLSGSPVFAEQYMRCMRLGRV